jgi:hypothetical protein
MHLLLVYIEIRRSITVMLNIKIRKMKTIYKSIGITIMITLSLAIVALGYYSTIVPSNEAYIHQFEITDGWQMDTLFHPTDSNRFSIALHYYQEIEYIIDGQDTLVYE